MPLPNPPRSTDDVSGGVYMDAIADNIDALRYSVLQFPIGDGEAVIETGIWTEFLFPDAGVIEEWRCISSETGSISIAIWKRAWGAGVPTSGDSIVAAAPIAITGGIQGSDTDLTGWSKIVAAHDVGRLSINSVSGINSALVFLKIRRT
ncbi:hypothetical protein [Xanthobacter flavus]|uniref:hypothetical protein n=1 Tax=Xanthobacter flavus TaxID=281 RepID=UPI00372A925D